VYHGADMGHFSRRFSLTLQLTFDPSGAVEGIFFSFAGEQISPTFFTGAPALVWITTIALKRFISWQEWWAFTKAVQGVGLPQTTTLH
jgi:hypothetical protein